MIINIFGKNVDNQPTASNGNLKKYHLGEQVRSGRYGAGQVRGFRPDGSVIVRFDGHKNSQVIFPSRLEKGS